jgi:hypothetical protein
MAGSSALREFIRFPVLGLRRMSFMAGRTAASQSYAEGRLWAVHVGRGEIVWQDRCDAANGSKEPKADGARDQAHTKGRDTGLLSLCSN